MKQSQRILALSIAALGAAVDVSAAALEEVVVTARKREEVIQEVPIAITAITGDVFEKAVVTNFEEATRLTPGFSTPPASTSPLAPSLSMRGSVQTDSLVTMDPSVGVYIDGIYIARTFGIGVDLLDLENIQVLKGPQGTLFGRNSTAGAMLLTTRDPELGLWSTNLSATVGPEVTKYSGVFNLPLLDSLALRLALQDADRDDYITNEPSPTKPGSQQIGGKETSTYRAKLRFAPTDPLDIVVAWDKFESDLNGPASDQIWRAGNPMRHSASDDTVALSFAPHNAADTENFSLTTSYSADSWEVKFLAAHREWRHMREIDYDGGDLANRSTVRHGSWGREAGDQTSYELQLNTSLFNEQVEMVSGVLYFEEFAQLYDYSYGTDASGKPPATQVGGGYVENNVESYGVYSQATWHIDDVSNLTLGLRYTEDKKFGEVYGSSSINRTRRYPSWDFDAHKASLTTVAGAPVPVLRPSEKFDAINWLVSYDRKFSDDIMGYVKASTGFRAGGFNGRGVPSTAYPFVYDPEEIIEYEVGVKADLLDGRLRWNTAVYSNETTDRQMTDIFTAAGTTTSSTVVNNAGKAEAKGFETEFVLALNDYWNLSGSYAYIDSQVTEQRRQDGSKIPSSELPIEQFIPENQWSLALNYDQEFSAYKLSGTVSYSWIDEIFGNDKSVQTIVDETARTSNPLTVAQARSFVDAATSDAFGLLNLSLTASPVDDLYSVTLWCRNALDERQVRSTIGFISGATYQYVRADYTEPRTWGVTVSAKF
jgi:iron complex outermembrane receptor protein